MEIQRVIPELLKPSLIQGGKAIFPYLTKASPLEHMEADT